MMIFNDFQNLYQNPNNMYLLGNFINSLASTLRKALKKFDIFSNCYIIRIKIDLKTES